MKKKILIVSLVVVALACLFAISVSAENNIIKLSSIPTFEEIRANPEAYVSHLDAFDNAKYDGKDKDSLVVLSDLAETPTYYVYPAYYYMPGSSLAIYSTISSLNSAISAADPTAFASYSAIDGNWAQGGCKYLIRIEVPTHVTTIAAKAKFEGSSNLLEVYFPTKTVVDEETGLEKTVTYVTSVSGENLFSSCTKLEYIHNMGYLPTGIVQGNNAGFTSCKALKEIIIPEGVTSIPNYMFKECYAVKEIVLPNSVTYMGKQAFAYCTSLEKFSFGSGFTSFGSPNNDYETFSGTNNLKFVYIPATVVNSLVNYSGTSLKNQFKNIFSNSSKAIYFLVGDEEDANLIKAKFAETAANGNIANADAVAYDSSVNYTEYQDSLTKSVIVYGYNFCDAFHNGEHILTGNDTAVVEDFMTAISVGDMCTREECGVGTVTKIISPIFECLGTSVSEFADTEGKYSITVGYKINYGAYTEYLDYGSLEFGLVASAVSVTGNEPLTLENGLVVAKDPAKTHMASQNKFAHDYVDFKLSGITSEQNGKEIVLSMYTYDGEAIEYLNETVIISVGEIE